MPSLDLDEVVIDPSTGETRKLGCLPLERPGTTRLAWPVFGDTIGSPDLVPRDQWFEVDYRPYCSPIKDQDGKSACNAFDTIMLLEMERRRTGLKDVKLSPGDLYYRINGGRDQGSMLEDALETVIRDGVATAATVPELAVYKRDVNEAAAQQERPLYRMLEAWWCPTFPHAASAYMRGYFVSQGIMWYGNDNPDADGWIPVGGRGRAGGHAIAGCGLTARMQGGKTVWGSRSANSWTPRWGRNGFFVIPEERANEGGNNFGWWAIRSVTVPSDDPDMPPAPNLKAYSIPRLVTGHRVQRR